MESETRDMWQQVENGGDFENEWVRRKKESRVEEWVSKYQHKRMWHGKVMLKGISYFENVMNLKTVGEVVDQEWIK